MFAYNIIFIAVIEWISFTAPCENGGVISSMFELSKFYDVFYLYFVLKLDYALHSAFYTLYLKIDIFIRSALV